MNLNNYPIVKPKNRRWYRLVEGVKWYECTACLEWKPEDGFYRRWDGRGRNSECRECAILRQRAIRSKAKPLFFGSSAFFEPRDHDIAHTALPFGSDSLDAFTQISRHINGDANPAGLGNAPSGNDSLVAHMQKHTRDFSICLDLMFVNLYDCKR